MPVGGPPEEAEEHGQEEAGALRLLVLRMGRGACFRPAAWQQVRKVEPEAFRVLGASFDPDPFDPSPSQVFVRRPSGNVSWMCRIQNTSLVSESHSDFPLSDLTALFHPSMEPPDFDDTILLDHDRRIKVEALSDEDYANLSQAFNFQASSVPSKIPSKFQFFY